MPLQQVLTVESLSHSVRSDIVGWSCEDPTFFKQGQPIGNTPCPKFSYHYQTVLEAMWDGWKLLAPPCKLPPVGEAPATWEWWLVRDA